MTRENRRYFAYGSNMDIEQMADRCPDAILIGKAELAGYKFILNSRGVATIVPSKEYCVHGVVWSISKKDENSLDKHEGIRYGTYIKETISIPFEGVALEMIVYIAKDSSTGCAVKPGYMKKVYNAAQKHGLDPIYIEELNNWYTRDLLLM